jgi:hypothetical protein
MSGAGQHERADRDERDRAVERAGVVGQLAGQRGDDELVKLVAHAAAPAASGPTCSAKNAAKPSGSRAAAW